MSILADVYGHSLALLTDLYQLTMAYGYWKSGMAGRRAVFHLSFRQNPFQGGFAVCCGLGTAIEFIERFRFERSDLDYLGTLRGADDGPLFERAFLDDLARLEFACDVDAMAEGTVVFPREPLVRVTGPLLQCQLLETPLLNIVNFQTLIATKAARICMAAEGDRVIEFGLRRAQGIDGGISASRAAYVGGCAGTSNVIAGQLFHIPVAGTHAHSWVMTFDDEYESFEAYAKAMPNNCTFLVDTYDTLDGVHNAVAIGRRLRAAGHELLGVRLDSGDLAALSRQARSILDEAGFPKARIVASNDLDERQIASLKRRGARIDVWGVGTKLVTAFDQAALGGVYKLGAVQDADGAWVHRIKRSEQPIKVTLPGKLGVRRYADGNAYLGDVLYDGLTMNAEETGYQEPTGSASPGPLGGALLPDRSDPIPHSATTTDMLVPVFRNGRAVYDRPALGASRARTRDELNRLPPGVRALDDPRPYPVGLDSRLQELKSRLIAAHAKGGSCSSSASRPPS
ncbi:MAG: nicotinate phosphoribosyltransferase [Planctomycetes bacterium]|nr:nicotinate phosphoribosyltransferase [Planctomycetota bacterium]